MKEFYIVSLFLISLFGATDFCSAQEIDLANNLTFNQNDLLVNGRKYHNFYFAAKGYVFFRTDAWYKSWVSVEGVVFTGVDIKLDIVSDKLLLKHLNSNSLETVIELSPELIDSFKIGEHLFVKNEIIGLQRNYVEQVYSGETGFYKLHEKEFLKIYNNFSPYGQISEVISNRFVFFNEKIVRVNTKREFLKCFSDKKKEINSYLKNNELKYRTATNNDLQQLMEFCDGQ